MNQIHEQVKYRMNALSYLELLPNVDPYYRPTCSVVAHPHRGDDLVGLSCLRKEAMKLNQVVDMSSEIQVVVEGVQQRSIVGEGYLGDIRIENEGLEESKESPAYEGRNSQMSVVFVEDLIKCETFPEIYKDIGEHGVPCNVIPCQCSCRYYDVVEARDWEKMNVDFPRLNREEYPIIPIQKNDMRTVRLKMGSRKTVLDHIEPKDSYSVWKKFRKELGIVFPKDTVDLICSYRGDVQLNMLLKFFVTDYFELKSYIDRMGGLCTIDSGGDLVYRTAPMTETVKCRVQVERLGYRRDQLYMLLVMFMKLINVSQDPAEFYHEVVNMINMLRTELAKGVRSRARFPVVMSIFLSVPFLEQWDGSTYYVKQNITHVKRNLYRTESEHLVLRNHRWLEEMVLREVEYRSYPIMGKREAWKMNFISRLLVQYRDSAKYDWVECQLLYGCSAQYYYRFRELFRWKSVRAIYLLMFGEG